MSYGTTTEPNIEDEIRRVLNKYSRENSSDTPDFILANYLLGCLCAFEFAVEERERWYGRELRNPSPPAVAPPAQKEKP